MSASVRDRVACVMMTRDRREEVLRTLAHLRALPERPRVVVVDNGSRDGTSAAVRAAHPWVHLLALRGNAGAVARNLGVTRAGTPYVAFCDDDSWPAPGALTLAAGRLDADPRLAVVNGRILVGPGEAPDPMSDEMARSPLPRGGRGIPLVSFLAGASVVRRQAFAQVGGFHRRIHIGGEEELLASDLLAAGWRIEYFPDVVVHHHPSRRRDAHLRRRQGIRNALWFTWLRRPVPSALRRTAELVRAAPRDRVSLLGYRDALAGVPWLVRVRRPVPPGVELLYRMLDGDQFRGEARRYVS